MSTRGARFAEVDVAELHFTHARVRPFFSGCGRRLEATLNAILCGDMTLESVPIITILPNTAVDGTQYYFSLNNRRLWVFKQLHEHGYFDGGKKLRVRVKEPLPREKERYTPERCSMTAKIMKDVGAAGPAAGTGGEDGEVGDEGKAGAEADAAEPLTVLGQMLEKANVDASADEPAPVVAAVAVAASKKKKSAPAPLSADILKSIKALAAQWKKAKGTKNAERKIQSQLDEWIDDGACAWEREEDVWALIRR